MVFSERFFLKLEAFSLHSFKTSGILKRFISGITWCCFNEFVFIFTKILLSKQNYVSTNLKFVIYFKLYIRFTTANYYIDKKVINIENKFFIKIFFILPTATLVLNQTSNTKLMFVNMTVLKKYFVNYCLDRK